MAREWKITPNREVLLRDSATGESCKTEKVVSLNEDCPDKNSNSHILLLYSRAKRGQLVQVMYNGYRTHFFINELSEPSSRHQLLSVVAKDLRIEAGTLQELIEQNVP